MDAFLILILGGTLGVIVGCLEVIVEVIAWTLEAVALIIGMIVWRRKARAFKERIAKL